MFNKRYICWLKKKGILTIKSYLKVNYLKRSGLKASQSSVFNYQARVNRK